MVILVIEENFINYIFNVGMLELFEVVFIYFYEKYDLFYNNKEIIVIVGVIEVIFVVL